MAIAIRSDVLSAFATAVQRAQKLGQQITAVKCDEKDCDIKYVIYYGPVINEAEIVDRIGSMIGASHPHHVHAYGFREGVPEPDAAS
jgi:hypothetical protein